MSRYKLCYKELMLGSLCCVPSSQKWTTGETGAIIITPTRELATQVSEVCRCFLPPDMAVRLIVGGRDVQQDVVDINQTGSTVVVATPGRLLVLLSRSDCKLAGHVRALVSSLLHCTSWLYFTIGVSCSGRGR